MKAESFVRPLPFLLSLLALVATVCSCTSFKDRLREQRPLGIDAKIYDDYAGQYELSTNLHLIVRREQERLMVKATGQDYFEVFPEGVGRFFYKVVHARLSFLRDDRGSVSGLILRQNGAELAAKRVSEKIGDPSVRVDAGGHRLRMLISGVGSPTVVLEAGLGSTLDGWEKVHPQVARFSRVVAYDRAGLGLSEPGPGPRSAENIARELHTVLRKAGLPPPYVLVGASMGGPYIRVFARKYSSEVVGLVFVDPSQEEYEDWLRSHHSDAYRQSEVELEKTTPGFREHLAARDVSLKQARAAWPLPRVPVILLTGMRHDPADAEKRQAWLTAHQEFLKRIPDATHIISEKSGHGVAETEPELVVDAIHQVVDQFRAIRRE